MSRAWGGAVMMLVACGPGLSRHPMTKSVSDSFLEAVSGHDAGAIADHFAPTLTYGGMFFVDGACMQQFPTATKIDAARARAFADCLATLDLRDSSRRDAMYGVSVYEYAPGVEIEAKFEDIGHGAQLVWIGYSGRRGLFDALPTVTPAAIERSRVAGDPRSRPSGDDTTKLEAESAQLGLEFAWAWMKLCLDADGNITGRHVREASSPLAEKVLTAATAEWKFRPVSLDTTRGVPVCALLRFTHPETTQPESIPIAFQVPAGALRIPDVRARRVEGEINVVPADGSKVAMMRAGVATLVGAFAYCFDGTGRVSDVAVLEPTGLPSYDERIVERVRAWRFEPFVVDGNAIKACSVATFIYRQR